MSSSAPNEQHELCCLGPGSHASMPAGIHHHGVAPVDANPYCNPPASITQYSTVQESTISTAAQHKNIQHKANMSPCTAGVAESVQARPTRLHSLSTELHLLLKAIYDASATRMYTEEVKRPCEIRSVGF